MIPIFEPDIGPDERKYLLEAFDSSWISSQGHFIRSFEQTFAKRFGIKYGVATSNCTSALHLSLVALGVGYGDEVICPDLTFIAPANMIALTGAYPVLIDVEEETWNLSPKLLEAAITERTKAIIVVHAFGHAARMQELQDVATKYDIPIIEDNAESPGATFKGKLLGTMGKMSCFSFFANKLLTTGEGGMILTNDEELYFKLRELRDHGMSRHQRYHHIEMGFNYRMTNMQGAIGLAQLERFDEILETRRKQEDFYLNLLNDNKKFSLRPQQAWSESVHWLMTIKLNIAGIRDVLLERLREKGIDCRQMIFPVHEAKHFKANYCAENYPVSIEVSHNSLHLPSSTKLKTEQIEWIVENLYECLTEII